MLPFADTYLKARELSNKAQDTSGLDISGVDSDFATLPRTKRRCVTRNNKQQQQFPQPPIITQNNVNDDLSESEEEHENFPKVVQNELTASFATPKTPLALGKHISYKLILFLNSYLVYFRQRDTNNS